MLPPTSVGIVSVRGRMTTPFSGSLITKGLIEATAVFTGVPSCFPRPKSTAMPTSAPRSTTAISNLRLRLMSLSYLRSATAVWASYVPIETRSLTTAST